MTPYFKYAGIVLIAAILTLAFARGAHACTPDGQDPFESDWAIQCSNTET